MGVWVGTGRSYTRQPHFGVDVELCCRGLGLAQNVTYNFMTRTNFANFHTFKWVGYIPSPSGEQVNQILAQEIQNAVVGELTAKGFGAICAVFMQIADR
jgi:hypothetical protein